LDAVWDLAERCWVKEPKHRPTASAICDILSNLLETAAISGQMTNSSSSHLLVPPLHAPAPAHPPNLTLHGHTDEVWCATFSPDGKFIVSGSSDGTLIVWDAQMGSLVLGPLKHTTKVGFGGVFKRTSKVTSVAFSANGRQIASGSDDGALLLWNAVTGEVVAGPLKGHTNVIWSVSFSSSNKLLASGSRDNSVRIWDAQSGYLLVGPLTGHTDSVYSVIFTGSGNQLASGSKDKTIRVWDVKSGKLVQGPLRGHNNWVRFVVFSPDGKRIVSASRDGDVCVWDTDAGALVSGPSKWHIEGSLATEFAPNSTHFCAVSPNGRWIVGIISNQKAINVWDSKTGLLVLTFSEHTERVWSVTFSPDSRRILTVSKDQTIQVHTLDF